MTALPRILLVDDSEDARLIARAALENGAFGLIDAAGSAQDAYEKLRIDAAEPDLPPDYDLILLDIVMPGVDGVEACAAIRSTRRYRDVPILMVSGQSDTETLNQAFIAGANDYVTKPLNPLELLARTRSALRFKREIDRRRARESALRIAGDGQGSLAGAFDPESGLPERALVEARIAAAAEAMQPVALLLIGIDGLTSLRSEAGEAAAARLSRRVASELGALPAPLGAMFGRFGEGQFMAVADAVTAAGVNSGAEAMIALAEAAQERIGALALAHGGSAEQDRATITVVAAQGKGDDLRGVPAAMIARIEEARRSGGDRIIRMDPTT